MDEAEAAEILGDELDKMIAGAPRMAAGFRLAAQALSDPELVALHERDPLAAQRVLLERAGR